MRTVEIKKYESLVRVRDFGKNYGHLFPKATLAGQEFAAVDASVKKLGGYAVDKRSTARDGALSREVARQALAEHVEMMRRTALAMAADVPDLANKFRMPTRTDTELLTAAHQFAQDAEPLQQRFVQHGMPKTFLVDLEAALEQFEAAVARWNKAKGEHVAARENIENALKAGFAAVGKLDAIVPNLLQDDPGTLANWQHERRVDWSARRRRSRHAAAGTTPTAPAVTSPAAPAEPQPAPAHAPEPVAEPAVPEPAAPVMEVLKKAS